MAEVDVAAALARSPVFETMSPQGRQGLTAGGGSIPLLRGQALFRRGDASDAVYVLLSGGLEVTLEDEEGRVCVLAQLAPGDLVGEMGSFTGQPRSADVSASRRSQLWRIGAATVRAVLDSEGRAAMALVAILADRLRETDGLVQRAQWLDVSARLAQLLVERERGSTTLSQGELARRIGASREAVNRRLAHWRRLGWVEIDDFGIHVTSPDRLGALYRADDPAEPAIR